jgi:hypothetical protein
VEAAKDGKSLVTAEAKYTKTSGKVTGRNMTRGSPAAVFVLSQISIKEPVPAVPSEQPKVG